MTFKMMLNFMIANNIKEDEYVLLCSMYYRNLDEDVPNLINKYAQKWGVQKNGKNIMFDDEVKQRLVEKEYLLFTGKEYQLTYKFLDLFVIEIIGGNELIDLYPSHIEINGTKIPLKTTGRMELRKTYWEAIGGSRVEHAEVIKDVYYGKRNGLLNMKISSFIDSEGWRDLRILRMDVSEEIPNSSNDL